MINELGHCSSGSETAYFATNEQSSIILLLRFMLHMRHVILLNLKYIIIDQRNLLTVFRSVQCEIQRNQSNLLTFKN